MIFDFEWDEDKRLENIRKHGIDFVDVPMVFDSDPVMLEDARYNYGERRFVSFGLLVGRIVAIVHTEDDGLIRIISARKASKYEQQIYFVGVASPWRRKSETDWARLDAMTDADIDLSDCPEVTPEMFAGAVVRRSVNNRVKVTVTITSGRLPPTIPQADATRTGCSRVVSGARRSGGSSDGVGFENLC